MDRHFTKEIARTIAVQILDKWGKKDVSLFFNTDAKFLAGAFTAVEEEDENEFDRLVESVNWELIENDIANPERWGFDPDDEKPTIDEIAEEVFSNREDFGIGKWFENPPRLVICLNAEHVFGSSGCSYGFDGGGNDDIDEDFWTRAFFGSESKDADEYLADVWDRVEHRCSKEINEFEEDGGRIEYSRPFREWNGGFYHGGKTHAEGETAETLEDRLLDAFQEIVEADQRAFYLANKDEEWAKGAAE